MRTGLVLAVVIVILVAGTSLIYFSVDKDDLPENDGRQEHVEPNQVEETNDSKDNDTSDSPASPEKLTVEDVPTEKRYASEFQLGSPPEWKPENEISLEDSDANTIELTRYPTVGPTPSQVDRAWKLYNESYDAMEASNYSDFNDSIDEGYQRYDNLHYVNEEYYFDDDNLNPHRPESLVYYDLNRSEEQGNQSDKLLAGYMYLVDGMEVEGEQVGGPLTVWHYHPRSQQKCFADALDEGSDIDAPDCSEDDVRKYRTPEMIHVWFVEHPGGPFSSEMAVPEAYLEEPEKMNESEFKRYALNSHENRTTPR